MTTAEPPILAVGPRDVFIEFYKSFKTDAGDLKYLLKIDEMPLLGTRSIIIDYDDLLSFNKEVANQLIVKPAEIIKAGSDAIYEVMLTENPEYAVKAQPFNPRFRRLPDSLGLRSIRNQHLSKLQMIAGIVTRATAVKQRIDNADFKCKNCGRIIPQKQSAGLFIQPQRCPEPNCGKAGPPELQMDTSTFIDSQRLTLQEKPEELPAGQLPRSVEVSVEGDIVDTARPGDRAAVTGILVGRQDFTRTGAKLSMFTPQLECNYSDISEKGTAEIEITPEDERKILQLSKDPEINELIIRSIAPSIYGHDNVKRAVALLLFGGVPKTLPDGVRIRGDINVLLVGDPGCLIGDERIVLGNGAIVKIQEMGNEHLQEISAQVLTGEGGGRRDRATCFHVYRHRPTIEIITESGKSLRGTYNHPLLAIEKVDGGLVRRWKRLDSFKIGDRVAVVTGFPCTVRKYVNTKWQPLPYHRGPHFRGRLPGKVTPDLAGLLGYMLGDGWATKYRVGFTVAEGEKDILDSLNKTSYEYFGIRPTVHVGKRKGRTVILYEAVIRSKDIAQNLLFLRVKRIPDFILYSGNQVVSSFLKWLYEADGTVFTQKRGCGAIGLKAKDIELLRDVQVLLLRFGIHSRLNVNALLIRRGESIIKFGSKVGFVSIRKRSRLTAIIDRAHKLKHLNRQRSERVVAVMKREPADVYDIEVPQSHRFIANGIISHNTAKSQLLQYVARAAPRGLYTTGRGTTAAGLTSAVIRDRQTGEYYLEAGALVLADGGVACVDEIDKMQDQDRVAMHEAMEQQTISIAKAGIVTTLNARTSVLAACNPKLGRYVSQEEISNNIDLSPTLLSRFDLIFIVQDVPDRARDESMASHILHLHESSSNEELAPIPSDLLKKYTAYSRRNISPRVTPEVSERLKQYFVEIRSKSEGPNSPIPITARQLEALVRLSEARARARLKDTVSVEDAEAAIKLMESCLREVSIDKATGQLDIDTIMTGRPRSQQDRVLRMIKLMDAMVKEAGGPVREEDYVNRAIEELELDADTVIKSLSPLKRDGTFYTPKPGFIQKA